MENEERDDYLYKMGENERKPASENENRPAEGGSSHDPDQNRDDLTNWDKKPSRNNQAEVEKHPEDDPEPELDKPTQEGENFDDPTKQLNPGNDDSGYDFGQSNSAQDRRREDWPSSPGKKSGSAL